MYSKQPLWFWSLCPTLKKPYLFLISFFFKTSSCCWNSFYKGSTHDVLCLPWCWFIFGLFTVCPPTTWFYFPGPGETCYWGVSLPGVDELGAPVDGLAACPSPRDCRRVDKAPSQVLHLQTVSHQGLQVGTRPLSLPFRPRFTTGAAYTHHRTLQPSGGYSLAQRRLIGKLVLSSHWLQLQNPEILLCSQPSDLEESANSYKWVSLNQFKSLIIHFLNFYLLPLMFFPPLPCFLTRFYDSFFILSKSLGSLSLLYFINISCALICYLLICTVASEACLSVFTSLNT